MFRIKQDIINGINLFSYNAETQRLEFRYTDEIKSAIENAYLKQFPNLNLNESTPQGQQITTLTQSFNACIDYLESCGTAFFLGGEGLFLDYWAFNLFGLKRKEGTPSSVYCQIQGEPDTKVPSTFQISDDSGHIYQIDKETSISETGYCMAMFSAVKIDDFVAMPNSLNQIVTIVEGVESVTNPYTATLGSVRETDIQFYQRAIKYNATAKCGSFRSILANVFAVEGTKRVYGYENVESREVDFKGTTIPPHCFSIVVEGGDTFEIIKAISESKGVGAGAYGDVEMDIWIDKEKYTYGIFRPSYVELKFEIVLDSSKIQQDTYDLVKERLINYCNSVEFGTLLTQPNLVSICYNGSIDKDFIKDLKFSKINDEVGYNDIELLFTEVPIVSKENIIMRL